MRYFDLLTGTFDEIPDPSPDTAVSRRSSRGAPVARSNGLDDIYSLLGDASGIVGGTTPVYSSSSGLDEVYSLLGDATGIVNGTTPVYSSSSELDDIYSLLGDASGIVGGTTPVSSSSSELDEVYALLGQAQDIFNGALPTSQPDSDLALVDELLGQGQNIFAGGVPSTGGDSTIDLVNDLLGQATQDFRVGMDIINRSPTISNSFGSNLLTSLGDYHKNFLNNPNTTNAQLDESLKSLKYINANTADYSPADAIRNSVNKFDRNLASINATPYGTFADDNYFNQETGKTQPWTASEGWI